MRFQVKVTAIGEVRDRDGTLISSSPVEAVMTVDEAQLAELGLPVPSKEN